MLLRQAAEAYGWKLNYGGIALMWRGGCIIRSAFLGKIKAAFDSDPDLVGIFGNLYSVIFFFQPYPGLRKHCTSVSFCINKRSLMSRRLFAHVCKKMLLARL